MRTRRTLTALFACAAWGLAAPAALFGATPAAALECGTRIAVTGDSIAQVRDACGLPASQVRRTELRPRAVPFGWRGPTSWISVQVDVWVYDFGPQRFMEELTFEDGVLRAMRTLGRGTSEGRVRTRRGRS